MILVIAVTVGSMHAQRATSLPLEADGQARRTPPYASVFSSDLPSVLLVTTIASLSEDELTVEPGSPVSFVLTVHNTGTVVDSFTLEPIGIPASWVTAEPEGLSLFPDASGEILVTVTPARTWDVAPGARPFALRVASSENPDGSTVEEGSLTILPFLEPAGELQPHTSHARGKRRGNHQLAVDNRGNTPLEVRISGEDRDDKLTVDVSRPLLVIPPGEAALTDVMPGARKGFWKGIDKTMPFVVLVEPPGHAALTVEGTFLNQARIPRWLPKLIAALIALAVIAAILWFTVLKPTIEDEAKDAGAEAAKEAVAPVAAQVAAQQKALEDVAKKVGTTVPPIVATPTPTASAPGFVDAALGNPASARLSLVADQQSKERLFDNAVFSLTDIVLSNPKGHTGLLTVLRNDDVLLQSELSNFRDLDYHFVSPLVFAKGQRLRATITGCTDPAPEKCEAAVFVSGYSKPVPAPAP